MKQKRSVIASLGCEIDLSAIRLIRKEGRKERKSSLFSSLYGRGSVDPGRPDSISSENALAVPFLSESLPCW